LLHLTEQHKTIYEKDSEILETFKEQAGSYENVIDSYNHYKDLYNLHYVEPALKIRDEIDTYDKIIKQLLEKLGLTLEQIFHIGTDKIFLKIYN
jgi:hypothetical protein